MAMVGDLGQGVSTHVHFLSSPTLLSWDIGQEVEAYLSLELAEDTDKYLVNIYEIQKVILQSLNGKITNIY